MKVRIKDMLEETDGGTIQDVVLNWLLDSDDPKGKLEDLQRGGCQSGLVGELIYYTDTEKFYDDHRLEIENLICDLEEGTGENRIELFSKNLEKSDWYDEDETQKKNTLAWFGFEETGHRLYCELFEN